MKILVKGIDAEDELLGIINLEQKAFSKDKGYENEAYTEELLRRLYNHNKDMFIIAKAGDDVVAFAIFVPLTSDGFRLFSIRQVSDLQELIGILKIDAIMSNFDDVEYYYFSDVVVSDEYQDNPIVLYKLFQGLVSKLNKKSQTIVTWPISVKGTKLASSLGFKLSLIGEGSPIRKELCFLDIPKNEFIGNIRKKMK